MFRDIRQCFTSPHRDQMLGSSDWAVLEDQPSPLEDVRYPRRHPQEALMNPTRVLGFNPSFAESGFTEYPAGG